MPTGRPPAGNSGRSGWGKEKPRPPGAARQAARQEIDRVVADQTADKIRFPAGATTRQPFRTGDGPVTVPMMRLTAQLGYARGDGWQVVTLPYPSAIGEPRLAMVVVLPDGPLSGMVSQFTPDD